MSHIERAQEIFQNYYLTLSKRNDRLFAVLFVTQWVAGILFAVTLSPFAWEGTSRAVHIHVYSAIFLGGLLAALPIALIWRAPGHPLNRYVVATSQILFSTLFIHITGGRIETHFHIFGSLAFLAMYRDWRILVLATAITSADHLLRGVYWPLSVYGVLTSTPWRALEHSAWVIFEDVILIYSIRNALQMLRSMADTQVRLEESVASVEERVAARTRDLVETRIQVETQQTALIAASKMSALGEMAAGVAHEINNPLAAIKTLSGLIQDIIEDESTDIHRVKAMVGKIEVTTNRIAKIVQGLRAFSRDESHEDFRAVSVSSLVDETLSFCEEKAKNRNVKLWVEPISPALMFEGHPTEVSQVLLNLLNNSLDAVESYSEKWIRIATTEEPKWFEILVTDSGPGIPPAIREKLFQPFFTTKEVGKGTGMGLSISLGIMRRHGGILAVDSHYPNTRFVMRIPKRRAETSVAS